MKKKQKKEIKIELILVYISEAEFQEKKAEIQNLIARMIVSVHKQELLEKTKCSGVRASQAHDKKP